MRDMFGYGRQIERIEAEFVREPLYGMIVSVLGWLVVMAGMYVAGLYI